MKHSLSIQAIVLLLLLLFLSLPLADINAEEQADVFIIGNADGTNTLSLAGSSALTSLIQTAEERFVLQYANAKNVVPLISPPVNLVTLLQSAEDRFVMQYANGKNVFPLTVPSAGLLNLLQTAEDRFVMQYANASNTYSLSYPVELVGDTTDPVIVQISPHSAGTNLTLTVETNEFTRAQLDYGLVSGVYTEMLIDDEYQFDHAFVISGLQSEVTQYYRVTVTDRSGNTFQSPEYSFELQEEFFIYLPLVIK